MKRLLRLLPIVAIALAWTASPVTTAQAAAPPGPFFQGFEQNTNGWFNGGDRNVVRRPSGWVPTSGSNYAPGVASAAGDYHARLEDSGTNCVLNCDGAFTRWGGYSTTFPPGGYRTQLDIYLDVAWAATHPDVRFDWTSAINSNQQTGVCPYPPGPPPPCHLRDFVFNAGTNPPGDPMPAGFYVNAATNAGRGSSFPENPCPNPPNPAPANPCRMPVHIITSGWYTFQHTFRNDNGQLAVDMRIFPLGSSTTVPGADWTIHAGDLMSTVGGNRYGWFANEEIPDLAIDNSLRTGLCRSGDGEGDVQDNKHGHNGHEKFHGNACEGGDQGGDVEHSDQNSGDNFHSDSVQSSTFTQDENSQTLTMVGTGTHNGLPVAFTVVAVDNGSLGPGLYSLVLSDGYTIVGTVINGVVSIQ